MKHATKITDHADRELTLTPFQLALFYRDWHMWQMIRRYMDPIDQLGQLQALEEQGTPHGTHYDFSDLNNAYKVYLAYESPASRFKGSFLEKLFKSESKSEYSTDRAEELWYEVGKAQARASLHVLQEFFRADRSFVPLPSFDEKDGLLPRLIKVDGTPILYDLHKKPFYDDEVILGHGYVFMKGKSAEEPLRMTYWREALTDNAPLDFAAMTRLAERRAEQYADLKAALLQVRAAPSSS